MSSGLLVDSNRNTMAISLISADILPHKPFSDELFPSLIEVHLVDKNNIFYQQGRILAQDVYRQIWNTDHLIDGNDYAVVIVANGTVIGNLNLQLKNQQKPLKSEIFFESEHWESYFSKSSEKITEISGLSVSQDLPVKSRQLVIMLLTLGTSIISQILGIDLWVTVQRKALNRILAKQLRLSFVTNKTIVTPQKEVPKDNYWNSSELPQIYYLDVKSSQNINAFSLFYSYLHLMGVRWKFLSQFQSKPLTFSAFYQNFY